MKFEDLTTDHPRKPLVSREASASGRCVLRMRPVADASRLIRTGLSAFMRIFTVVGLLLLAAIVGCGSERLSPSALAARKELQFERAQVALDKLSAQPVDDTPEGHYLRAIALERLNRMEAANAEAKIAVDRVPKNPKYLALVLRLQLFRGDEKAIEPLLELHDQHPSSAAVSLCSIYAFQAKSVQQRNERKLRAAKVQLEKAEVCLQTAVSLAAEIPECHNELVGMSIWFERPDDALKLLDGLLHEEPDNIDFLRNRTKVLMMAKKSAETISAAGLLYRRLERTEAAAVEFANTLNRLQPSPAVLEQYASLRESFPQNTAILLRQCWSLGKAGRMDEVAETLGTAFDHQPDKQRKRLIAESAVAIPLEIGEPDAAEKQLKRYRSTIRDNQLLTFFEGQLAYLRKDYELSYTKMNSVLEIYRKDNAASHELSQAALGWIRRLVSQQTLTEQVRRAAELTLRRSALNRGDEPAIRDEAQSLLNLLESTPRQEPTHELQPTIGRPATEEGLKEKP